MTDKAKIRAEIERRLKRENEILWNAKLRGTYASPSCEYNLLTLTSIRDFIDSLPEEPAPKESDDLEEAAEEYALNYVCAGPYNSIGKYGFMAGAIWQKLKMMEGAVEGEITKDIHNLLHVKSDVLPMPTKHRFGDKVKIIIIKDDDTRR